LQTQTVLHTSMERTIAAGPTLEAIREQSRAMSSTLPRSSPISKPPPTGGRGKRRLRHLPYRFPSVRNRVDTGRYDAHPLTPSPPQSLIGNILIPGALRPEREAGPVVPSR